MRHLFARGARGACDNSLWIAERANVEIEFGKPQLPSFPLPEGFADDADVPPSTSPSRAPASGGATQLPDSVVERLAYELKVIGDMGFSAYFLITWDLIRHARDTRHPGRARAVARRPAARWPTACASPTSTRSATTSCSSASSTPAASRCPTSTWTSTPATGTR